VIMDSENMAMEKGRRMPKVELKAAERLDDLMANDLKIIQSDEVFCFSMDAVLLAHFCSVPARGNVLDLCTGNGVVPLILTTRTKARIQGVEIQPRLADMAARNVTLNGLDDRVEIVCGDLRTIHERLGFGRYDLVTVNPPYLPVSAGEPSRNVHYAAARHEIYCTLEDVVRACSRLVKTGGKAAIVHRPFRLIELLGLLRQYGLEPKRIRFVHPRAGAEANMVLVEAIRGGKPEVRLLPPLIVYGEDGRYCPELQRIYNGDKSGEAGDMR